MTDSRRALGTRTLSALVVANMIGAGVFTTSGFALGDLGSPDLVMLAWGVGGVMAILGALCYGALAARLNDSGGEYLFLSRTLHPLLGFLAGWVSLWAGFTGAIAFAAEATQTYCAPWLPDSVSPDVFGTFVLLAIGCLHSVGLGPAKWIQNLAVSAKLLLLLALVVIGWSQLPDLADLPAIKLEPGSFTITLMWVSLSYSGWNAAVYIAGEARDPKRTLPRALMIGTVAVTVLYLALNWVFVHAAPIDQLAGQQDIAAVAANAIGGPALESLVRVILVIALCTSISSMVMIGPRVIAKMADDGVLPKLFAFTGQVPRASIWLQVVLAIVVLWASDLRAQLTNLGWILSLFTGLSVFGLIKLRRREGAERVPIPGYPFVPLAFLATVLAMTTTMMWVNSELIWPSLGVLVSGVFVYAVQGRKRTS